MANGNGNGQSLLRKYLARAFIAGMVCLAMAFWMYLDSKDTGPFELVAGLVLGGGHLTNMVERFANRNNGAPTP